MGIPRTHVVLLSSPGVGHRTPILQLAKRLVTDHAFHVTVFLATPPTSSPRELQLLGFPETHPDRHHLHLLELPPVDLSGLIAPNAALVTQLCVIMREACAVRLRSAVAALEALPPAVLIGDFFSYEAAGVARDLGVPFYIYFPTSAWFSILTMCMPVIDKAVDGEYVDQEKPILVPRCRPVRPVEVVDPMMDRSDQQYQEYVRMGVGASGVDGILINTWHDLEAATLRALEEDETLRGIVRAPVHPIGPLTTLVEPDRLAVEVLKWLDRQPNRSVIFVCFGSAGTLSGEQMKELAWGLERSGQRFVWVVRPPTGSGPSGAPFGQGTELDGPSGFLPQGFLGRTSEVGLMIENWAAQSEILAHPSVGGFLSHCGWNSTLESITNGVPIIAWPLFAEQKMNSTLLTEELGIAVRPEGLPTVKEVVVGREEVERLVRKVMEEDSDEGKAMRDRVEKLKCRAVETLSKDGKSYNRLRQLVEDCRVRSRQKTEEGR